MTQDIRDPIEQIKNTLDIKEVIQEYVRLEKAGTNYRANCPFHKEKTPSFFVSPTRQLWRCFGCGEGGDMFTFVENIEGVGFAEALRSLAAKAGVELKRQDPRLRSERNRSMEICELAAKYFQYQLESKNGKLVVEYLKERGLTDKSIEDFRIGYAPRNGKNLIKLFADRKFALQELEKAGLALKLEGRGEYIGRFRGRIMFPILDASGNPVGFGGRSLTEELAGRMNVPYKKDLAKYINSPQTNIYDKSRVLYGLSEAKLDIRREDACVVVEGYTDVILAHQHGYRNVVASSGTSLTETQLNLIKRFTNNLLTSFDMDTAGDTATRRGIALAQERGFNVKVIALPEGKDPADIFTEGDKEGWEEAVKNAKSVMQFYFDTAFQKHDAVSAEGKREIGKELTPVVAAIPSRIEQAHWVKELAFKLNVDMEDAWEDVRKAAAPQAPGNRHTTDEEAQPEALNKKEMLVRQALMHVVHEPALGAVAAEELKGVEQDIKGLHLLKDPNFISEATTNQDKEFIEHIKFELEVLPHEWSEASLRATLAGLKKAILEEEKLELQRRIEESEKAGDEQGTAELLRDFHNKISGLAELG